MIKNFCGNHLLDYFTYEELDEISKMNNQYLKAKLIVTILFKDKVDKAGKPYLEHLIRVSGKLNEEIEKVAALLHDTLEDTEITEKDLLEINFPLEIIEIVKLVTHDKIDKSNMTKEEKLLLYNKEINKVINSGNIHAIRLKEADMSDNYDLNRLKDLPQEKQEWFHMKYGKQLIKLRNAKKEG